MKQSFADSLSPAHGRSASPRPKTKPAEAACLASIDNHPGKQEAATVLANSIASSLSLTSLLGRHSDGCQKHPTASCVL